MPEIPQTDTLMQITRQRQEGSERHNEKRIREPWSITCLPQSSPRERTPLFFETGGGDSRGEGEVKWKRRYRWRQKMKGCSKDAAKYIPV